MNLETGSYLKLELFNEDAHLFVDVLLKITKEQGAMGFKLYGITEKEMEVLNSILQNLV
jgi:hypothetical protein